MSDNGSDSFVLAVDRVDIDANGDPIVPATGETTVANHLSWSHADWTQEKLGNVYGTAIDGQGNMFATASASYGSGFGFAGDPAQVNYGSIGRAINGELGAAGTVYKMDAVTGAPVVFAQLPQQATTIVNIDAEGPVADVTRTDSGPGLGQHSSRQN